MKNFKQATVLKLSDHYIVHPDNTTMPGYGIASPPFRKFSISDSYIEITKAVLAALSGSKSNVPVNNYDDTNEYLRNLGIGSMEELHQHAICCAVHESDGTITFTPTINLGPVDGFDYKEDKKVEIKSSEDIEKIAIALEQSLNDCEVKIL